MGGRCTGSACNLSRGAHRCPSTPNWCRPDAQVVDQTTHQNMCIMNHTHLMPGLSEDLQRFIAAEGLEVVRQEVQIDYSQLNADQVLKVGREAGVTAPVHRGRRPRQTLCTTEVQASADYVHLPPVSSLPMWL